jgi:hypothetical protein
MRVSVGSVQADGAGREGRGETMTATVAVSGSSLQAQPGTASPGEAPKVEQVRCTAKHVMICYCERSTPGQVLAVLEKTYEGQWVAMNLP